jgi:hypothetical protein
MILNTLPKEIRRIPINRSPLIRVVLKSIRKGIRKKNDFNVYLKPDFLKKEINYGIFEKIISENKVLTLIDNYEKRGLSAELLHKLYAISCFKELLQ